MSECISQQGYESNGNLDCLVIDSISRTFIVIFSKNSLMNESAVVSSSVLLYDLLNSLPNYHTGKFPQKVWINRKTRHRYPLRKYMYLQQECNPECSQDNSGTISIVTEYKDASFRAPPSDQGLHDWECRLQVFLEVQLTLALCSVYAKGWRMSTCHFVWISADHPHLVQMHFNRLVCACLVASVSPLGLLGP